MTDLEKATWMAKGYKAKCEAIKLSPQLSDFELMRRTFGFYQWKKNNSLTDEQLACFEKGYKHIKP